MVHKITYISTLYNKSDYIIRVLESICNQDTNNFIKEIIVIDDGSTDDSYQKVLDFKRYSPIPINVISQANKGPSAALNAALRVLSGDFVCFVDADDVLLPYATSLMIEYLEKNKVDVVFGKIAENYNEIEDYCITDFKTKRYSKPIKETLQSLSVVGATRSLAKVDIIKKAGFCNENIRTQDYQLTLSICRFTDFLFIDKYLAYNLAPKSERFSFDKKREINDINLSLLDFLLKNQDLPKNLIKFGINRCLRRLKRFKKISFFKYIKYKILLIIHISNPSNIITNILTFINK